MERTPKHTHTRSARASVKPIFSGSTNLCVRKVNSGFSARWVEYSLWVSGCFLTCVNRVWHCLGKHFTVGLWLALCSHSLPLLA